MSQYFPSCVFKRELMFCVLRSEVLIPMEAQEGGVSDALRKTFVLADAMMNM